MNEALDLHHKLVRKLLHQHAGHEADTEGDSFIIAFSTPWDALGFGQVSHDASHVSRQGAQPSNVSNQIHRVSVRP